MHFLAVSRPYAKIPSLLEDSADCLLSMHARTWATTAISWLVLLVIVLWEASLLQSPDYLLLA
jgi:hypothetical protein